jgi:hypothetical protein
MRYRLVLAWAMGAVSLVAGLVLMAGAAWLL